MTDTDLSPEQQVRLRIAEAYISATAHDPVTPEGLQEWITKMTDVVIHGMVLNRVYP